MPSIHHSKAFFLVVLLFVLTNNSSAQKEFPIWPDKAPGSEKWDWHEQTDTTAWPNDPLVFNVSQPTLTFFPAQPPVANGAAVIICPGGAFYYLHINTEGTDIAKWLNKKGVSAFVLKYRLVHCETNFPVKERNEKRKDSAGFAKLVTPVVPLGISDARQALAYVRQRAATFGVSPTKIGIIGFSAGGTLATAAAFDYNSENRPDFIVPIYPYVPPSFALKMVTGTPPMFIAAATDDEYHLVPMSINLYNKWLESGHSAELHIYSKGGHGFGMNQQHLPSDSWIERLGDWLQVQGIIK